jgi:hypothetical protein
VVGGFSLSVIVAEVLMLGIVVTVAEVHVGHLVLGLVAELSVVAVVVMLGLVTELSVLVAEIAVLGLVTVLRVLVSEITVLWLVKGELTVDVTVVVAANFVVGLVVAVLVLVVVGDNGAVFVVDGTSVGLVLELDVGLLLVVLLVMRVVVNGLLDVNGVVMDNTGLVVVVLVVFLMGKLMGELVMILVVVVIVVVLMGELSGELVVRLVVLMRVHLVLGLVTVVLVANISVANILVANILVTNVLVANISVANILVANILVMNGGVEVSDCLLVHGLIEMDGLMGSGIVVLTSRLVLVVGRGVGVALESVIVHGGVVVSGDSLPDSVGVVAWRVC